ncbi:hypothetical protein J3R82DRAFT_8055 [Butyriboletus roseoflavus]|nr:hypothetical protein J3R82DRAFT_8055 [Butyriboletus roseoflavus]
MSTLANEPPSPPSPHAGVFFPPSVRTGLFSAQENGHRPHDSSDSDSTSKDSLVSPASDRHSLYSDDPLLKPEPLPQSSKEKSPRRVYFDYGIPHLDPSSPVSSKFEDSQDMETGPSSSFHSYTQPTLTDKDFRTEPPLFYHSQPFWLTLYFCFNLGLTLYNKAVLIHFPYAYALTALHALCGSIGGFSLLRLGVYVPAKLTDADNMALLAFSSLYTFNIAVSNLSLELVTIPFHQVVRSATPIFTVFLSMLLFGTRSSRQKIASLVPVIVGVGFATYGDYYFTTSGFLLTLLGTLLAAIKTIYTSILQSSPSAQAPITFRYLVPPRLQLHPLDLLTRMAPLAFIQCVILSYTTGEMDQVRHWSTRELTAWTAVALGLNGAIAFGLNIVSFTANKKAGPLSMTVAVSSALEWVGGELSGAMLMLTDSKRKAGFIHRSCGRYL